MPKRVRKFVDYASSTKSEYIKKVRKYLSQEKENVEGTNLNEQTHVECDRRNNVRSLNIFVNLMLNILYLRYLNKKTRTIEDKFTN